MLFTLNKRLRSRRFYTNCKQGQDVPPADRGNSLGPSEDILSHKPNVHNYLKTAYWHIEVSLVSAGGACLSIIPTEPFSACP